MSQFDNLSDKAKDMAGEHGDKIEEHSDTGLDKAEEFGGDRLGDEHADKISQGRDAVDERLGDGGGEGESTEGNA